MSTMFYSMSGSNCKKWAVATASPDTDELALWDIIKRLTHATEWPELHLALGEGVLADWAHVDIIGRVCSPKLKATLDAFSADILWLPVYLHRADQEYVYHFMHFTAVPDVLDEDKTIYAGQRVFKPHLSLDKVGDRAIICLRLLGGSVIVRQDVKAAVEDNQCLGIEFQRVPASRRNN